MAPIVLPLMQGAFLLLLYLFVWRIARVVLRDIRANSAAAVPAQPARQIAPAEPAPSRQSSPGDLERAFRAPPRELVVRRDGGSPTVLPLDGATISFGRAAPSTVVLDDPYVSDSHAKVWRDGQEWVVTDLGSTNGTFLNQVKVTDPTPLAAGDQLGIGKTTVEVRR